VDRAYEAMQKSPEANSMGFTENGYARATNWQIGTQHRLSERKPLMSTFGSMLSKNIQMIARSISMPAIRE
jgi:hypothetical protein